MNLKNVFLVLHSPESGRIVNEFTRITIRGFDLNNLVLSRVSGSATRGVEQASKECFMLEKNFLVTRDLEDFLGLVKVDKCYLFPPPKYATKVLDIAELRDGIDNGETVALVFGGGKVSGLTKKEMNQGEAVKIIDQDIGALGTVAILLGKLLSG